MLHQGIHCTEAADLPGRVVAVHLDGEVVARRVIVADDLPSRVLCLRVEGDVYARASCVKNKKRR